uniref:Uncharacterized protein n=1 Tax=Arundo donax TaxID=35708 RepID=A0A0A9A6N5_ARUDO
MDTDNYTPEVDHNTLSETFTETDPPKVVTGSVINSESAVPDDEPCCSHSETTFGRDTVLSSYEIVGQNEQVPLCTSSTGAVTPDLTVNTEEEHEVCQALHQEPPNSCNSSTDVFGDSVAPDSTDVPLPIISSFDWMLNGTMQQSLNILPAQLTYGNTQENGSSDDAPPLPPLPPMQWRTNKLQMGSSPLSTKVGRPPRPKPPVKHQESEGKPSLDERNEEAGMLQESSLHNGLTLQNKMVQAKVPDDHETTQFLDRDSQANPRQGDKDYYVQDSNPLSSSEAKSAGEVATMKCESLQTLQLPELIVIPEEAWSEFGNINFIPEQEGKHQFNYGVSECNGLHTAGLLTKKDK